jgi:methanol---5-hydroxybenzimidazolylcobamide Co-methyltransferase
MKYKELAIQNPEDLVFGTAVKPVKTRRGLEIGGGEVYPELNFTLPPISINKDTFAEIKQQYHDIVERAIVRAVELNAQGLVFEFETLLEMTQNPDWGVELVKTMNEVCEKHYQNSGFKSEIRLTPNDLREFENPPKLRSSALLDKTLELFERGGEAGGDMFSIESTGGKEICDDALMMCDTKGVVFSLAVLGVRDMKMLWSKIVEIAEKQEKIAAGDTACGFANTAMVLAEKKFIPRIFAAMVRIVSAVRTIIAVEEGAVGPDKDCGYEGVFIKAITGTPISMEGKTAACAHLSPLGNIAAACADLWSNESVQNIKLLADWAPTVYLEQLEYDTRLFNQAVKSGKKSINELQRLLVNSDITHDPQALILAPENVIAIASEMVKGQNHLQSAVFGALKGLEIIENSIQSKQLLVPEVELMWIETIRNDLQLIPANESEFVDEMLAKIEPGKFLPEEYGL